MDLDSVLVHKHAKKELGQYPDILTSHLVNNPYLSTNGIMEGKERQEKAAKVISSSAESKGYAKFKGRL